nr:hypothetical protein [Tanacetum cinerariifolium]
MRIHSSSNLVGESSPNPTNSYPKRHNRRRSKQPFILEESPVATMADQRTMAELLRAHTEVDQNSLNSAAYGNLLERHTQDVLTIIENKSKIAKLTHAVNWQTSDVTTTMTAILKQFQANLPPAFVKSIEEICVTCSGAQPYYQCLAVDGNTIQEFQDNIQGYVSAAAVNYNQGNFGYRPSSVANQIRPLSFDQPNVQNNQNRFSQPQGYNRGKNFNQDQVVPLSSEPLPNKSISNPKGELKAITTRSGLVLDGSSVPMPPPFINLKEDEHAEETLTT